MPCEPNQDVQHPHPLGPSLVRSSDLHIPNRTFSALARSSAAPVSPEPVLQMRKLSPEERDLAPMH